MHVHLILQVWLASKFHRQYQLMAGCAGAVVLGVRDLEIKDGSWRKGTKEEISLSDRYMSTEWTQIEAGMAVMAGLPVLIVSETGIRGGVFDVGTSEHLLYRCGVDDLPGSTALRDWCMVVRLAASQPRAG